ncbi:MAG TPA: Hsp20/alpha crystallin family protein [Verrucomicrobiae bacterium]|jgi:HSP20 family protein|nr:Hsp20/alpha crystallin family protein [Verrucomicrobiae bacterium]
MAMQAQTIPVRIYRGDEHIMLAAPLPGLEPENIWITISGEKVCIQGDERGPGQRGRDMIVDEWTIGPYYREVKLPEAVDGPLTNATYGNGVLVLSMPKSKEARPNSEASFKLHPIEATHGERIGHTGMDIHPKAAAQHDKKHRAEKKGDDKVSMR